MFDLLQGRMTGKEDEVVAEAIQPAEEVSTQLYGSWRLPCQQLLRLLDRAPSVQDPANVKRKREDGAEDDDPAMKKLASTDTDGNGTTDPAAPEPAEATGGAEEPVSAEAEAPAAGADAATTTTPEPSAASVKADEPQSTETPVAVCLLLLIMWECV